MEETPRNAEGAGAKEEGGMQGHSNIILLELYLRELEEGNMVLRGLLPS